MIDRLSRPCDNKHVIREDAASYFDQRLMMMCMCDESFIINIAMFNKKTRIVNFNFMVTLTRELATTDHFFIYNLLYVRRMLIIVSVCSLTETDMIAWARPSRKHSSNLICVNPDIEHVQPISV